jgi:hypothetical protein
MKLSFPPFTQISEIDSADFHISNRNDHDKNECIFKPAGLRDTQFEGKFTSRPVRSQWGQAP